MRNLEYKTLENFRKVMGYQYQLTKPEQLLNGGLTGVLAQMAKTRAFGKLAIELAASILPSGNLAVCLNVRVYAETPQKLYELRDAASEDLEAALEAYHILYKKARFDDEGTVAQMPLSGYRYLRRCCIESEDGTLCAVSLEQVKKVPWEQVLLIIKNNVGSGFSIQWIPTVLTWEEMECAKRKNNGTGRSEKQALYAVTAAFWGDAAMELTNSVAYWMDGAVEPCVFFSEKSEYDKVTLDPWGLCEVLSKGARWPFLFTQLELQYLLDEQQKEQGTQKNQESKLSQETLQTQVNQLNQAIQATELWQAEISNKLKKEELAYLGISSEEELGMTKEQLDTLKTTILSIRPMGIFSGMVIAVDNYFSFTSMIGYLYELLMATCYYDHVYVPYARMIGQENVVAEVGQTELVCYEQGPVKGYRGFVDEWSWNAMSQKLSKRARFSDGYWTSEEWRAFFRDMRQIRTLRNQVHVLDKTTNQIRFVSRETAEEGIEKMLCGKKSLMRRILQCAGCTIL